jgi:pimeloyl-ACP methyl ester carboxylesterase
MAVDLYRDLLRNGADAFVRAMEEEFAVAWNPEARADFGVNDLRAWVAMLTSEDLYWPGFAQQLQSVQLPCLILVGEDDGNLGGAEECAMHLPRSKLVVLPGLDHMQSFCHPAVALPHVRQFLAEVGED